MQFYYSTMKKIWTSFLLAFSVITIAVAMVISLTNSVIENQQESRVLGMQKGLSSPLIIQGYSPMAAPINDNWPGTLMPATVPIGRAGTNIEATFQANEPELLGESETLSSWFYWEGSNSNTIYAHTCDSDFDTILGIYTGSSLSDLVLVDANDDGCAYGNGSAVQFTPTIGQYYYFQIAGYSGAVGNYTLMLDFTLPTEDPNVTETPTETPSEEPTEEPTPTPSEDNLALSGYVLGAVVHDAHKAEDAFIAMTDGDYGNNFDSWTGEPKTEDYWGIEFNTELDFNRVVYSTGNTFGDGGWFGSDLKVQVRQGGDWYDVTSQNIDPVYQYNDSVAFTSYTFTFDDTYGDAIRVWGIPEEVEQTFQFTSIAEFEIYYDSLATPTPTPAIDNDDFANAQEVFLGDWITINDLPSATLEIDEPNIIQQKYEIAKSRWYEFTPVISRQIMIDNCLSASSTRSMLAVYTGNDLTILNSVVDNNYGCKLNDHARVSFYAQAGQTYMIQLSEDADYSNTNGIAMRIIEDTNSLPGPPNNDNFLHSQEIFIDETDPITGDYLRTQYNAFSSTVEAGEDTNGGMFERSLWYHWTNDAQTRQVWLDTCAIYGSFDMGIGASDSFISVYTGNDINSLTVVAENDEWNSPTNPDWACSGQDLTSFVTFEAQPFTTYRIRIVEISNRNNDGLISLRTEPEVVETLAEVPEGNLWCSNHDGIAVTIPYTIAEDDWPACWSWCQENMTENTQICQMNGDGPRNCWINYSPTFGMDTCQWVDGVYGPNTWPKGSYWGEIVGYIMSLRPSLSGRLITNENINVSFNRQKGERTIMLKNETNATRVVEVNANFVQDLDWTSVDGDSDINSGKAYMHNVTEAPYADDTFSLYVPIPENKESSKVVICPNADEFTDIYRECNDVETRNEADADTSIVSYDGQDYWKIDGMSSTGGYAMTAFAAEIETESSYAELNLAYTFTVNALDNENNIDENYIGTVTFSSTATDITLPSDYTFTSADAGSHQFTATFHELGVFTITVEDTLDSEINFTSSDITVVEDLDALFPCDYAWTRTFGSDDSFGDTGEEVTTDINGNVYATGTFRGANVNFNTTGEGADDIHSSNGGSDVFVTKYNQDGSYGWTRTFGGNATADVSKAITTDVFGNIYITGYYSGTDVNFNTTGSGSPDLKTSYNGFGLNAYILKYNADGSYGWTRTISTTSVSLGTGLRADSNGNLYTAGYFNGFNTQFNTTGSGSSDIKSSSNEDVFLIKYNADGSYGWTRTVGGINGDYGTSVQVDELDNVYFTGYFHSADVNFNSTGVGSSDIKGSNGNADIFITKYNADGSYAFTRTIGGSGYDIPREVAFDNTSNYYVVGTLGSTDVNFNTTGSGTDDFHSSIGATDVFIIKYNADNSYGWTRTIGGTSYDDAWSVVVDSEDSVYFTGAFAGENINFNTTGSGTDDLKTSITSSYYDFFITKYSAAGVYVRTRTIGGTSNDRAYGAAIDTDDNLYIIGNFIGLDVNFNTTTRGDADYKSSVGSSDVYIQKYTLGDSGYCGVPEPTPTATPTVTPTLTPIPTDTPWEGNCDYYGAKTFGSATDDTAWDVYADADDNIYITGIFTGADVDFNQSGEGPADLHSSNGGNDIFVTKYNADRSYAWTITFGGIGDDGGYGANIDIFGNLYITGYFSDTVNFNNTGSGSDDFKTSNGGVDVFITKLNSDLSYAWTYTFGTEERDVGLSVVTNSTGEVYLGGYFSFLGTNMPTEFNTTGAGSSDIKTANGSSDAFLTKYNVDGSYGWTNTFGSWDSDNIWRVAIDSNDNIFISGIFYGDGINFNGTGSGADDIRDSNSASSDIFLSKYNADDSYAWTRTVGGEQADFGYGISIDASDSVYVTGNFYSENIDFNGQGGTPDIKSSSGGRDIFITKYANNGDYLWTETFGNTGDDFGWSAVATTDAVYLSGHFQSASINFNSAGEDLRFSHGGYDVFITKLDLSGNYISTKAIGGSGLDWAYGMDADSNGKVYLSGRFEGTDVAFNRNGLGDADLKTSNGMRDAFVVEYSDGTDTGYCDVPTPTQTETPTLTPTMTPTVTPTNTPTFTPTVTVTSTITSTVTPTVTATRAPTVTNTPAVTITPTVTTTPIVTIVELPEILEIYDVQITQINNAVQICWKTTRPATGSISFGISEDNLNLNTNLTNEPTFSNCQALTVDTNVVNHYFEIAAYGTDGQSAKHKGTFQIIITDLPVTGDICRVDTPVVTGSTNSGYRISFNTANNDSVTCTISYGKDVYNLITDGEIILRDAEEFSTFIPANKIPQESSLQYQIVCRAVDKECSFTGNIALDWPKNDVGENLLITILGPQFEEVAVQLGEIATSTPAKTAAIGMVGIAATSFLITNPQIFLMGMVWVYRRPKNKRFGLVYDIISKDVLPFAVIRLLDPISLRTRFETVSDLQGRYHLVANEGKFLLEVEQDGYAKYSLPLTVAANELQVTTSIGLSKLGANVVSKIQYRKILNKLNKYVFSFGFIFSLAMMLLNFHIINLIIVAIYLVQIAILALQKPANNWGQVINDMTGKPLKGVFASILDIREQRQVDIRMSDNQGRFGFILDKKSYLLKIDMAGYKVSQINQNWESKVLTTGEVVYQIPEGDVANLAVRMEVDLKAAQADNATPVQKFGNVALGAN